MKNTVKGFHRPTDEEFMIIFKSCIFIVDTNFILNIYRYEKSTKEAMLKILESITDRLWLPNYAAIEFQRNRPKVIAEQKKKFCEVRKIVEKIPSQAKADLGNLQLKKRHNLIDTDELVSAIDNAASIFLTKLSFIEESQIDVYDDHELRSRIEGLFENNIGEAPDSNFLEEITKDGEKRYKNKIPPGYCDIGKGNELDANFSYGGLVYERKFGDLIIWNQILKHSQSIGEVDIIFLTDDSKEDWWWVIDSGGPKRIGPRPELVEEMVRVGRAKSFYIYGPEQFLQFSNRYLNSNVSEEAISDVRQVSVENKDNAKEDDFVLHSLKAVRRWLESRHPGFKMESSKGIDPDYIIRTTDGRRIGIEYIPIYKNEVDLIPIYFKSLEENMNSENLQENYLIIIFPNGEEIPKMLERDLESYTCHPPGGVQVFLGYLEKTSSEDGPIDLRITYTKA